MRKSLPVTGDAKTLKQRLQRDHNGRKKPRLQMLYRLATEQAQTRQEVAQLPGVHRHTIGHWLARCEAAMSSGETAMYNDLTVTYDALRQRGFASEAVLVLAGPLTRSGLLAFLHDIHRRIAPWPRGDVWFSFSGHGTFTGMTTAEARPRLLFTSEMPASPEHQMFWDEVFAALQVPPAVQLSVLPDS